MPASITLSSPTTTVVLSSAEGREPPLVSQRIEPMRSNDQAPSYQKIVVEFSGLMEGISHDAITAKLSTLQAVLQSNEITLIYNDGVRDVINGRVWNAGYSDPIEWKQYSARYGFSVYYFQDADNSDSPIGLVTFAPNTGPTYSFDPAPSVSRMWKENRTSHREPQESLAGTHMAELLTMELEGFLRASTPELLEAKVQALRSAFSYDGLLNFGNVFTQYVRTVTLNVPMVFPQTQVNYTITLAYDTGPQIIELELSREFSRVHYNPLIKEWMYCPNPPQVTLRNLSGQTVSYSLFAKGYTIDAIETFLANEAQLLVISGGTEVPGGRHFERIRGGDPSVSLSFTKFHSVPVKANLANT